MTTKEAAKQYLNEHLSRWNDAGYAVYNPHGKEINSLPIIYGFNNGGSSVHLHAVLIAEDGTSLGSHGCSDEAYMRADLGILEGSYPGRHKDDFMKHYPDGYRMDFVPYSKVPSHKQLQKAFKLSKEHADVTE